MSKPEEISLTRHHRAPSRSVVNGAKPREGKRNLKPWTPDVIRLPPNHDRAYLPQQLELTLDPAVKVDQPPPSLHLEPGYRMLGATFSVKPAGPMGHAAVLHPSTHRPPQIIGNRS